MMTDDPIRSPLKRRLLVLRLATIGGAASMPGIAAAQGECVEVPLDEQLQYPLDTFRQPRHPLGGERCRLRLGLTRHD